MWWSFFPPEFIETLIQKGHGHRKYKKGQCGGSHILRAPHQLSHPLIVF